jgi:hypothetical protein
MMDSTRKERCFKTWIPRDNVPLAAVDPGQGSDAGFRKDLHWPT